MASSGGPTVHARSLSRRRSVRRPPTRRRSTDQSYVSAAPPPPPARIRRPVREWGLEFRISHVPPSLACNLPRKMRPIDGDGDEIMQAATERRGRPGAFSVRGNVVVWIVVAVSSKPPCKCVLAWPCRSVTKLSYWLGPVHPQGSLLTSDG